MVFGLEQRFEAGRNLGLEVPDEGTTAKATTRLSFGLTSRTPIDTLEFTASTALVIENSPDTDGTEYDLGRPDLTFGYTREIPDAVFAATARFRRDDVDATADDLSDKTTTGTRTDTGATLRYETGRTGPLDFSAGLNYSRTDYTDTVDPDLNDKETIGLSLGTRLRFSEVLTGTGDVIVSRTEEDDAAQTLTEKTTVTVGAEYAISRRLAAKASIGVTEIEKTEFGVLTRTSGPDARLGFVLDMPNGNATADFTLLTDDNEGERTTLEFSRALMLPAGAFTARVGLTRAEGGDTEIIGGVDWTRELPESQIRLSLDRDVDFDEEEDETEVKTTFTAAWDREVNALSSVGLDFSYRISDAPSQRIEQTEIGATYRYALTRDWSLNSGLRYRVRDDADGRAESPSVFVSLGRKFEF